MPVIHRPKRPSQLSLDQLKAKEAKDTAYEKAHIALANTYYSKPTHTPAEQTAFFSQSAKQWQDYVDWSIASGLYEEVSVEQQEIETIGSLNAVLDTVNALRVEQGKTELEIREKGM